MGSSNFRQGIFKFGHGHLLQIADLPTDLWDGSKGLYPFQTQPVKLFISSDNAADVNIPIMVEGLDANGMIQQKTAVLNGQVQVELPGLWWRQYRAVNADSGTLFQGYVYVAEEDTLTDGKPDTVSKIKIDMEATFQQTQMLVYTTPRDWISKVEDVFISIVPKNTAVTYAKVGFYMRQPGKSWTCQGYTGLITSGTSAVYYPIRNGQEIPPFTDIVLRILDLSANDSELAGSFSVKFIRKAD